MPLLTLKAKSRKPSQRAKLVVRANEKVTDLLEETGERVLVVYEGEAANIYYEEDPPPAQPKAS